MRQSKVTKAAVLVDASIGARTCARTGACLVLGRYIDISPKKVFMEYHRDREVIHVDLAGSIYTRSAPQIR
jgi:hypothetical protein